MLTKELKLNLQTCQPKKIKQSRRTEKLLGIAFNLRNPYPQDRQHAIDFLLNLFGTNKNIMNVLIYLGYEHKNLIYAEQQTIGDIAGDDAHRITVSRLITLLDEWGLLTKHWNGYNKSLWVRLSSFWFERDIIEILKKKFPFLYRVLWKLLLEATATRSIIKEHRNIYNIPTTDEILPQEEQEILHIRSLSLMPLARDHLETVKKRNLYLENVSEAVKNAAQLLSLTADEIMQLALDEAAEYFAAEIDSFVGASL